MGISKEIKLENRRKYKNEKMKSYDWYCDICNNSKNYTLRTFARKFSPRLIF